MEAGRRRCVGNGIVIFHAANGRFTSSPVADRFWEKVDRREAGECWPWKANFCRSGLPYGQMRVGRTQKMAHRISWEMHLGPVLRAYLSAITATIRPASIRPIFSSEHTRTTWLTETVKVALAS